jgi:hypothetical protein
MIEGAIAPLASSGVNVIKLFTSSLTLGINNSVIAQRQDFKPSITFANKAALPKWVPFGLCSCYKW